MVIATGCASTVYDNRTPRSSSRTYDARDFTGSWQLAPSRGDYGRNWLDERARFGADWNDNGTDRRRYDAWFLPDAFRIDGDRSSIRILDENGDVIADVPMDTGYRYGSYNRDTYDPGVRARWISDRRFEVQRVGNSGRRVTQTFTLQNRSRELVVETRVERDGGTRTYTRVYERA
jgi:hypothetical protein